MLGTRLFGYDNVEYSQWLLFGEIEVGNDFACVLDNQGAITCWGSNTNDRSNVPEGIYLQFTLGENLMVVL